MWPRIKIQSKIPVAGLSRFLGMGITDFEFLIAEDERIAPNTGSKKFAISSTYLPSMCLVSNTQRVSCLTQKIHYQLKKLRYFSYSFQGLLIYLDYFLI